MSNIKRKSGFNTVIFRVDGSSEIGIGHLMRCVSLAEELSMRGFKPVFCTKPAEETLVNEILKERFRVLKIPVTATPEQDAECLMLAVRRYRGRIVILDGYNFDSYYLKLIRRESPLLLSIDDIAQTSYCSDIVLNQNIDATRRMYFGKISKDTKLLLGPDYALLRPEFKRLHIHKRRFGKVDNILVTFGGADPDNQTLKVLKALEKIKAGFDITVALGISDSNRENIMNYIASSNRNIKLLNIDMNMAKLMLKADIAVSAGGSTVWELCCLGLPTLQIILAKHQEGVTKQLGSRKITVNLGWYEGVTENNVTAAVKELINNTKKRRAMSHRGKSIVDGRGAERVVSEIYTSIGR